MNLLCELLSEFKKSIVPLQLLGALGRIRILKRVHWGRGLALKFWCIFCITLKKYFTEKLLPFLVPIVSIFYATPQIPNIYIYFVILINKGMLIYSNCIEDFPPACLAHSAADPSCQNGEYKRKDSFWVLVCMTGHILAVIFFFFVRRIYW